MASQPLQWSQYPRNGLVTLAVVSPPLWWTPVYERDDHTRSHSLSSARAACAHDHTTPSAQLGSEALCGLCEDKADE
eukprot:344411-Chlamydomonas_euryale.AAC.2